MAKVKNKYWRSLVFIVILIAALWGWNVYAHARDVSKVRKDNKTRTADLKEPRPGFLTYGLDLRGGLSVVLEPTGPATHDALSTALSSRFDIIGVMAANFPGSQLEQGGVDVTGAAGRWR